MHCPRCQKKVDLEINQCPKCDRKLKLLVLSQQIPLTAQQRHALRSEIIVLSIALGFLVCITTILYFVLRNVPPKPNDGWTILLPMFGVLFAFIGYSLLSRVRDLHGGHAQVQIDQLLKLRYVRSNRRNRLYGDFKFIGSQHLKMEHGDVAREGNYYVVTHSPHSNNVWELVKLRREVA